MGVNMNRLIRYFSVLSVALATMGIVSTSHAKRVFSHKKWILDITGSLCTAQTYVSSYDGTYYLNIILDYQGNLPVQVMVVPKRQPTKKKGFYFKYGSDIYNFVKLPANNNGNMHEGHSFWSLPKNTAKLIHYIKAADEFRVIESNGVKGHRFSLAGSSVTVSKLYEYCGKNSLLAAEEFESMFLNSKNTNLDLFDVDQHSAVQARAVLADGVDDYKEWFFVREELDQLEEHYANLTQESKRLKNDISVLENQRIPYLNSEKIGAQAAIDQAEVEKQEFLSLISQKNSELQLAQSTYNKALAARAPYKPQHDQLQSQVNLAQSQLSSVSGQLSNAKYNLERDEGNLRRLQIREDDLRRELRNLEFDLQSARTRMRQARKHLNNFRPEEEFQRRVRNNQELKNLRQRAKNLRQRNQEQALVVDQATLQVKNAQSALNQCLANSSDACDGEQHNLTVAKEHLKTVKRKKKKLESELNQVVSRREQVRNQIRSNVNQQHENLRQEVRIAERQVTFLDDKVRRAKREKEQISFVDIPRVEREIAEGRLEVQSLMNEKAIAEAQLSSDLGNLHSFKVSVGYDALEAEVVRTRAVVDGIEGTIASYQYEVAKRDRTIQEQADYKNSLTIQIAEAHINLKAKKSRLVEVKDLLVPYNKEKNMILVRLEAKRKKLMSTSQDYTHALLN